VIVARWLYMQIMRPCRWLRRPKKHIIERLAEALADEMAKNNCNYTSFDKFYGADRWSVTAKKFNR
jgi:hypothetical protein